jgi:SAM-dependent methyltransferase
MTQQTVEELSKAYGARADVYAELWQPVLHPKGRALLERLDLRAARTVLDLGTGTGTLLADIAELAPSAAVVAIDRSEGMIRKAARPALRSVMDAQIIALADGCIDAGVMAFVIFTVPDPPAAMAEVARVLKRGGSFGVATWGDEPDVPADTIWAEELDAHGAGPDTVDRIDRRDITDTPQKLAALFDGSGFGEVNTWTDRLDLVWKPDDYFRFWASGPITRRLATLDADARRRCLARIRTRLDELDPDAFAERSQVVYATGVRR